MFHCNYYLSNWLKFNRVRVICFTFFQLFGNDDEVGKKIQIVSDIPNLSPCNPVYEYNKKRYSKYTERTMLELDDGVYKRKRRPTIRVPRAYRRVARRSGRSSKMGKRLKRGMRRSSSGHESTFAEAEMGITKATLSTSKGRKMVSKQPVVRSHFPETWLFQLKPVDKNGEASVSLKALDNFTS